MKQACQLFRRMGILWILLSLIVVAGCSGQVGPTPTPAAPGNTLTLAGHSDAVNDANYSPDGKYIVTASTDKTARVWDAQTGKELRQFGHDKAVYSASFSVDGKFIVTASADTTIRIWDANTGSEIRRMAASAGEKSSASFSADGKYVVGLTAVNGSFTEKQVSIWDAATGNLARSFAPIYNFSSVVFSPDGKSIVAARGGENSAVAYVWDAQNGKELFQLRGHKSYVANARYSPDGKLIVTAGWDNTARIWDATTGKEVRQLAGFGNYVDDAAFSPDGATILTVSEDGTLRLWNANTGQELRRGEMAYPITLNTAHFSADGKNAVFTVAVRLGAGSDNDKARQFVQVWTLDRLPAAPPQAGIYVEVEAAAFTRWDNSKDAVIPSQWKAANFLDARYLLHIHDEEPTTIEECAYSQSGSGLTSATIIRQRIDSRITISDRLSGEAIATKTFLGSMPDRCPSKSSFSSNKLTQKLPGGHANPQEIRDWVATVMAGKITQTAS